MECFRITLRPEHGSFHAAGGLLVSHSDVTPRRITHLTAMEDESIIVVCLLEGDADALDRALRDREEILDFQLFGRDGPEFKLYLRVRPESPATELLALTEEYNLVLDTPIEIEPDGSLTVAVAGTPQAIQQVMSAFPTDLMSGNIRHVGGFEPETGGIEEELTDIQRSVVEEALRRGYYAIPRQITQAELADEFDCSAATVGEHLRKAEQLVLSRALE